MADNGQNTRGVYSVKDSTYYTLLVFSIFYVVGRWYDIAILSAISFGLIGATLITFIIDRILSQGETKMPDVSDVVNVTKRYDLKSAPPDGFVVVRRMNYGEELVRQQMSTKFLVGGNSGNGAKSGNTLSGELDINTADVAFWDFANLIVEHNLTRNGAPLNFKSRDVVKSISGPLGKEIGTAIDEWNSVEETEDIKN